MTDDAFQIARAQIDAEHDSELVVLNKAKDSATTALQNGSLSTVDKEIILEEYKLINEKGLALFEKRFTSVQNLSQKQFDNYWAEKKDLFRRNISIAFNFNGFFERASELSSSLFYWHLGGLGSLSFQLLFKA